MDKDFEITSYSVEKAIFWKKKNTVSKLYFGVAHVLLSIKYILKRHSTLSIKLQEILGIETTKKYRSLRSFSQFHLLLLFFINVLHRFS